MNDRHSYQQHLIPRSGGAAQPELSRAIQERLGCELRDMYAEIQSDTTVGRLADLVKQLERKDATLLEPTMSSGSR
jgi:hypothetical protein